MSTFVASAVESSEPVGTEEVVDQPLGTETTETTEGDQTAEPEAEHVESAESGTEGGKGEQVETKEDGRLIPQKLREIRESNPDAFKIAKGAIFGLKAYQQVHPTVDAARADRELVQSIGGQEGITRLQEDASVFATASDQFLKGDPAFVADLFAEDPIAAALHVAPMLENFQKHDQEGYNSTIARIFNKELTSVGMGPGVDSLVEAIKAKNFDLALRIASDIKQWKEDITGVATKAEDPRVKTLLAERAKARETEQGAVREKFLNTYKTESIQEVGKSAEKAFESYFRNFRGDDKDKKRLINDALKIANEDVVADTVFQTQRNKHLQVGNSAAAKQLTVARYDRAIPDAVARIARLYGLKTTPAQSKGTQQQQQTKGQPQVAQGWTRVNARPNGLDIDRGRTTNDMILSGKAIMKDGKKLDWSHLKSKAS